MPKAASKRTLSFKPNLRFGIPDNYDLHLNAPLTVDDRTLPSEVIVKSRFSTTSR